MLLCHFKSKMSFCSQSDSLSPFHCHGFTGPVLFTFTFFFSHRQKRHTKMKLVQDRNALLPVPTCDLIAQEALCSCAIVPTVTATLNGRMSCFKFRSEAPWRGSLTTGRIHSGTKQGGNTLYWPQLHTHH